MSPGLEKAINHTRLVREILIVIAALVLAIAMLLAIGQWLASSLPPAPRSPFGVGPREAAPGVTGLGAWLSARQAVFFQGLTGALKQALADPAAAWTLIAGSFLYGLVHAAGPGHGKAVIASYIVADRRSLRRGIALSVAAALLQAVVAIALTGLVFLLFRATAATLDVAARLIETAAFAAITIVGLAILLRKAAALAALCDPASPQAMACGPDCDHAHIPGAQEVARIAKWQDAALVVVAAGARPCAGALIVLGFAASQKLFAVGVASAFAMAAGVALATSALAIMAVGFKALALRLAGGRGLTGARVLLAIECLIAAGIAALGIVLALELTTLPYGA